MSILTLLEEVQESTRRVSGIVAAVRSYTQMDRASRQEIDVRDGLESTLVVLGPKLRQGEGVAVVRDYGDDVPRVDAHPGELNQVWTNLIDNAVDAMGGSGTLGISTRPDGDGLVVEIADTGAGLPPRSPPAPSRRSSRRSRSAAAPASASTSRAGSSSSATAVRSRSTAIRAGPCSASASQGRQPPTASERCWHTSLHRMPLTRPRAQVRFCTARAQRHTASWAQP